MDTVQAQCAESRDHLYAIMRETGGYHGECRDQSESEEQRTSDIQHGNDLSVRASFGGDPIIRITSLSNMFSICSNGTFLSSDANKTHTTAFFSRLCGQLSFQPLV